jgi:hypothetical protein
MSVVFGFVLIGKKYIFVITKVIRMKKIVAFVALAAFISACSQYTCPTYAKKAPKKISEQRI